MSYCLNPNCLKPQNSQGTRFCITCGTKLLLADRYRAIRIIGQGGFGRTFLAEDEHKPSKPRCVIKQFYSEGQSNNRKAAELFEQEATRLEKLGENPQIPNLYAYLEQDNRQYIVQEYIDGQNLMQELAANGAFSEEEIRSLLRDLLPVVQFLHQGEVIHRDIKPANIIRRRLDNKLVLVDFGAAKHATATALAKTGTVIGSAEYVAPEQMRGKAIFASDIYSLGVTCLYLLTRVSPFDLFDVSEDIWIWRQYLVNNPVSEELGEVLDKMVENSLKERYRSAEEVMQDLNGSVVTSASPIAKIPTPTLSENFSLVATFSGSKGGVLSVAISPDGQKIASGSKVMFSWFAGRDNNVRIWDLENEKVIYALRGHSAYVNSVAFSPDGKILASGSDDKTIKLWEVSTGREIRTIEGHSDSVASVKFSPNGKILASASRILDSTIKLWKVSNGKEICTLKGHSSWVGSVAFSPDGKILASASTDKTIKLWKVKTGKEIRSLQGHSKGIGCLAFSPDSKTLVSGSDDKTIKLWEISTGREIQTLIGHSDSVCAVVFSPDGKLIASGGDTWDTTIKLWEAGREIQTLRGHSGSVNSIDFSPDGKTLVSGSSDTKIKIWRYIALRAGNGE